MKEDNNIVGAFGYNWLILSWGAAIDIARSFSDTNPFAHGRRMWHTRGLF